MRNHFIATAGFAITVAIAIAGCAASVYPEPGDPYVYDEAPVGIYAAPRVYYGDSYAYYVDGRWYRQTPRGWAYYRTEPAELARRRAYVQQAPPARAYEAPHVTSAPVRREQREHEEREGHQGPKR